MKRTRVAEFVARLTCWRYRYADLRNQPCYIFSEEIDIEEAKRRYPNAVMQWPAPPPGAIGRRVGYTVYAPLEVEVDPMAKKDKVDTLVDWVNDMYIAAEIVDLKKRKKKRGKLPKRDEMALQAFKYLKKMRG